jgi:ATP-binding cassette, subfamily B, bacterial
MKITLKYYGQLLTHYLKPYHRQVVGLAIALLGSIGLQIVNPQLIGYFIDAASSNQPPSELRWVAGLFVAIAVATQGLAVLTTYLSEIIAWSATNALRFDLVKHCLSLDLSFHQHRSPGELLERVDGDVNTLSRFFSQWVIHVLGNGFLLIGILIALWMKNAIAGLSLSLFAVLSLTLLVGLRSFAIAPWGDYRQLSAEFFGFVGEHLAGREDIRANGAVSYVMQRFHALLQRWLPIYQKARFASTVLWATSVGLFTAGNAIALAVSAYLWQQQAISLGTAYLIFHYTNLLAQPIERIREELEEFQQVEASLRRIQELRTTTSSIQDNGTQSLPSGALAVTMDHLCFAYELGSEWTLHDLSFHLESGKVLGLVGRTGSGKSTIARLLLRFHEAQQGHTALNGVPIYDIPLTELRHRVGLVTQDVQLFQASVRDNLSFFNPSIRDVEILETLEWLGLAEWVRSLPHGLDTVLAADSQGLSAGQAQLLAFARVFLQDPGLVILDEASSRLDPMTEQWVERAVDRLLTGRTALIIAHRLSTLNRVDQVLILDHGKILEYGDRATLAQDANSHFARLVALGRSEVLT